MIIRLLSIQVPMFWETIKFVAVNADEVDQSQMQGYLNELLQALLSEKAQCFVRLDEQRVLKSMLITRIIYDKVFDKAYLLAQCLYSFQIADPEEWARDWKFICEFAKKEKCNYISFDSRNKRIWEVGEALGFKESRRNYKYLIN